MHMHPSKYVFLHNHHPINLKFMLCACVTFWNASFVRMPYELKFTLIDTWNGKQCWRCYALVTNPRLHSLIDWYVDCFLWIEQCFYELPVKHVFLHISSYKLKPLLFTSVVFWMHLLHVNTLYWSTNEMQSIVACAMHLATIQVPNAWLIDMLIVFFWPEQWFDQFYLEVTNLMLPYTQSFLLKQWKHKLIHQPFGWMYRYGSEKYWFLLCSGLSFFLGHSAVWLLTDYSWLSFYAAWHVLQTT